MSEKNHLENLTPHYYLLSGSKSDKRMLIRALRYFPVGCLFDENGNTFREGFEASLEDSRTVVLYPLKKQKNPIKIHNQHREFMTSVPVPGVVEIIPRDEKDVRYIVYSKQ